MQQGKQTGQAGRRHRRMRHLNAPLGERLPRCALHVAQITPQDEGHLVTGGRAAQLALGRWGALSTASPLLCRAPL